MTARWARAARTGQSPRGVLPVAVGHRTDDAPGLFVDAAEAVEEGAGPRPQAEGLEAEQDPRDPQEVVVMRCQPFRLLRRETLGRHTPVPFPAQAVEAKHAVERDEQPVAEFRAVV